jgi:hypothetical protein
MVYIPLGTFHLAPEITMLSPNDGATVTETKANERGRSWLLPDERERGTHDSSMFLDYR